jgi:glutamate N-acetyltransferase/amino-acid N-acetyltransferase
MDLDLRYIDGGVCAPKGFQAAGIRCGIRPGKTDKDLALIYSKTKASAACVYTQNKVFGAPITVTRRHVEDGIAQAVLCNSGNANTCNEDGIEVASSMCSYAARELGIDNHDIIVASTGVIGQPLPIEPIANGLPALVEALSETGSGDATEAIMTTDTFKKEVAVEFVIDGVPCRIGGIAKGSGMINPNMATMLCFVTTDAAISPALLQQSLSLVVKDTLNMVCVDGDTSTNDMLSVLANGQAKNKPIDQEGRPHDMFTQALFLVLQKLAAMIARDGEGATKLLTCTVKNAPTDEAARAIAKSVIASSLFKAAMFGRDANWGRVLCAVGYTPVAFSAGDISVSLASDSGRVDVCEHSHGLPFSEEKAAAVLAEEEIQIDVDLHDGHERATAFGCDLTYDYVKINGDYRT